MISHFTAWRGVRPLVLAVAAAGLAGCATSEMAGGGSGAHPDLSGFWNIGRPIAERDPELVSLIPEGTVFMDDAGGPEFVVGDYGGLILTPYAEEVAENWKPTDDFTMSLACATPSIAYSMQGPFPFEIYQSDDFIIIRMEYFDVVRIIFMDGRGHPGEDAPHYPAGHSIGHWEGDILVVDTTHIEPYTLTNNGLYHSDQLHVIERFKLSDDGQMLMATQEYEDPVTLQNRGYRFISWDKGAEDDQVYPYDCDPSFALNYGAAEQ